MRDQLKLAEMVAPFVPGIGTGVAAALGAANALAAGRPITEAVLAAARGALPGGAIAQAAFDVALNLAKGKNIAEAALAAARDRCRAALLRAPRSMGRSLLRKASACRTQPLRQPGKSCHPRPMRRTHYHSSNG